MRFWNRTDDTAHSTDWGYLMRQKTKGALLSALQREAAGYTADDLEIMIVHYDAKIRAVPEEYRKSLEKYARIQITDGYNLLATAALDPVRGKEKLPKFWKEYAAFAAGKAAEPNGRLRSLKYLIGAFMIFIEEKPPHPEGMPFPGGHTVERYEGVYYCPVRNAWNDDESAFCRFCPAVQSREQDMVLSKSERDAAGKKEKITNYFYNFKG